MISHDLGKVFFTGASVSLRDKSGYSTFAAGKAGLRMVAQSMARELDPQNIHIAHLIIDATVDTEFISERFRAQDKDPDRLPEDSLMKPNSVAEAY